MANISALVTKMKSAQQGNDVRDAIADTLAAVNVDNVEIITLLGNLDPVEVAAAAVTATTKAGIAVDSAADAMDSEVAAAAAKAASETAKTAAELAETHAETAETNSKASETASKASEQAAAGSAGVATIKAGESATSAADALAAKNLAEAAKTQTLAYKDATIAAVGQSTNMPEIIESRKGKATLGEKISEIDSQLADIKSKVLLNGAVYGVRVDKTNSNPDTRVAYIRDSIGFTPMSGNSGSFSWGSWEAPFNKFDIRPCLLKNGVVQYHLNPIDYTKKADGTVSDITSGNDGDAMIEFGKPIWYKWTDEGTTYTLEISDVYFAGAVKNAFEVEGGYNQMNYYPLLLTQILFVIFFKSTNSQIALGRGYVDTTNTSVAATGGANAKGMFYGETTGKQQLKFLGIEDFCCNLFYWVDGIVSDANWNILLGKSSFNDTGAGYASFPSGLSANLNGFIVSEQGGNDKGFIIKTGGGSGTTYYSDYGDLFSSCVAVFGGRYSYGESAGFSTLQFDSSTTAAYAIAGGRLFYSAANKIYIGVYLGNSLSSKLRSLSGKIPTVNQTIGAFRTLAKANN